MCVHEHAFVYVSEWFLQHIKVILQWITEKVYPLVKYFKVISQYKNSSDFLIAILFQICVKKIFNVDILKDSGWF